MNRRPILALLLVVSLLALLAVPALAAKPTKADKANEAPITVTGTIRVSTDAAGNETYTLRSGGTTYTLGSGPSWFFGDKYPLKPYVGKSVTVVGEIAEGSTEVEVVSVDGKALREPGKPPWAGGWKRVGQLHPGWSQEKADNWAAKFGNKFGDCWPPGQCKEKTSDKAEKADKPDGSEAPEASPAS